jgi:hypothetical protein
VHLIERHHLHAAVEVGGRPAHQALNTWPDVHPARHTQGFEHDVDRSAIGQVGHAPPGEDAADDALVAVAAGHLVAHLDLAALRHIDPHNHVGARRQFIALLAV